MKIIIISHGEFCKGLCNTIEMIMGKQQNLTYLSFEDEEPTEEFESRLENEIENTKEEILVLSDLYSGTPFNCAAKLTNNHDLYHITGINVPLTMEAISMRNMNKTAKEICEEIIANSALTIVDVRKKLEGI